MKSIYWFIGGFAAVTALILLKRPALMKENKPVDKLAHKLQDAWADHHTVA